MTDEATADVCDRLEGTARTCTAQLRLYGGRVRFGGVIDTVRCREDNVLVRTALSRPGQGRVLVVDGAGSLRTALLGDALALLARDNGWSGVIVHGAVRDVARLRELDFGMAALGSNPHRSGKAGTGTAGEPVSFGEVVFTPGDTVHVDEDGVVLVPRGAD
ncbi:ribonuclease E activity regulator RraA [Streptomyces sp. TRM68416]|uniref:ribonuclease E activity regulator RraA n=1 Tax=Streptomyces sp. TRM68416 TaxID=2758412 RepID=UPI001661D02D|nr:ribonuclease E activity regulator RraA [Streptomyces sp. TRM68416]MBD0843967.1 ribonuclease E activity regulator RraA [Streptomyces sp. TRM68416]